MSVRLTIDGTIKAWRSQTVSIFFGDNEKQYFAWLPSIPEGVAVADVTYDSGKVLHLMNPGYHDHNWGNISMLELMHYWYLCGAKIGNYKEISSWITAGKKYCYKDHDVSMIAKNGEILGHNSNHTLKFMPKQRYIDEYTGKVVYNKATCEYAIESGDDYRITYERINDISKTRFVDVLPKPL